METHPAARIGWLRAGVLGDGVLGATHGILPTVGLVSAAIFASGAALRFLVAGLVAESNILVGVTAHDAKVAVTGTMGYTDVHPLASKSA